MDTLPIQSILLRDGNKSNWLNLLRIQDGMSVLEVGAAAVCSLIGSKPIYRTQQSPDLILTLDWIVRLLMVTKKLNRTRKKFNQRTGKLNRMDEVEPNE